MNPAEIIMHDEGDANRDHECSERGDEGIRTTIEDSPQPIVTDGHTGPITAASKGHIPVHVDVCMKDKCTCDPEAIEARTYAFVRDSTAFFSNGPLDISDDPILPEYVSRVYISIPDDSACVPFWTADISICVYQLSYETAAEEMADNEEEVVACHIYTLPSVEFDQIWENLIFEEDIKCHLLNYAATAMHFSDLKVDPRVIAWNRMLLLHGPPGSGKTSLAQGLAQMLSIRMHKRFPHCQLVNINAHSLFSKWFSESGKLVMKLFHKIHDLVSDSTSLVILMIDEVESLAGARQAALSGSEPSDSIRVVNALLTQLDNLKRYPNVLVCCTSNLSEAIDLAFLDRSDLRLFVGPPSEMARYEILKSCISELVRAGVIVDETCDFATSLHTTGKDASSNKLADLSRQLQGMSGRSLRRLPFQAQSLFLHKMGSTLDEFITAMHRVHSTANSSSL